MGVRVRDRVGVRVRVRVRVVLTSGVEREGAARQPALASPSS